MDQELNPRKFLRFMGQILLENSPKWILVMRTPKLGHTDKLHKYFVDSSNSTKIWHYIADTMGQSNVPIKACECGLYWSNSNPMEWSWTILFKLTSWKYEVQLKKGHLNSQRSHVERDGCIDPTHIRLQQRGPWSKV